jgi:S1-C subfamily serine protease
MLWDSKWPKGLTGAQLAVIVALVCADASGVLRRVIPPLSAPRPEPAAAAPVPALPPVAAPDRHQPAPAPPIAVAPRAPARIKPARWEPLGETKFVPELRDGRPIGLRLSGVGNDGLFAKLGLRDGDRLDLVGGHSVTSAREMIALYTRLRTLDELKLLIERDGQPLTITIHLQ